MTTLMYSALDLAAIISGMELGCQEESHIIDLIWEKERDYFSERYRADKRKFILDIRYWMNYFYEKPDFDREFPAIQKDIAYGNHDIDIGQYVSDYSDLDLFFKSVRIRILYGKENSYVRLKLHTLLAQYGYRRRSKVLLQHITQCMQFYHLEATLRGGAACNLETCGLDKMITFRIERGCI